ncbi:MAG: hypothetical protein RMY35_008330 [Nostoc sp. DedSLP01]
MRVSSTIWRTARSPAAATPSFTRLILSSVRSGKFSNSVLSPSRSLDFKLAVFSLVSTWEVTASARSSRTESLELLITTSLNS